MQKSRITLALLLLWWGILLETEAVQQPHKKVIYHGWGSPTTKYIREHWEEMEQLPLDGTTVRIPLKRSGHKVHQKPLFLGSHIFSPYPLHIDDFQFAIDDLKSAQWKRFTDNFLSVHPSPPRQEYPFSWFDDQQWRAIVQNWEVIFTIARESGLKGIVFDPETYGIALFTYEKINTEGIPFETYKEKVKSRAKELMRVTNRVYPTAVLFLLHGYSLVWKHRYIYKIPPEKVVYNLYPSFLDGLVEESGAGIRIVDGHENTYASKMQFRFERAHQFFERTALQEGLFPKYRDQLEVGFPIFIDCCGPASKYGKVWDPIDFKNNYYPPDLLEYILKSALTITDRYVWIYAQKPRFFPPKELSNPYLQAIENARLLLNK